MDIVDIVGKKKLSEYILNVLCFAQVSVRQYIKVVKRVDAGGVPILV